MKSELLMTGVGPPDWATTTLLGMASSPETREWICDATAYLIAFHPFCQRFRRDLDPPAARLL